MSDGRTDKPTSKDQRAAGGGQEGGTSPLTHHSPLTTPSRNPRTLHIQLRVGDRAHLKKPHPCGSSEWEVLRLGAEVKFRCAGCGHVVSLPRSKLATALRGILPSSE